MLTDILVILDRSGSMSGAKADHEGGLRAFVDDQQADGDALFTLVQFDSHDPCEIVYDRVPIADVGKIELVPRGGTPLYDAMGRAIIYLRARQSERPSDVTIVLVVTDGENNEWREHNKDSIRKLIAEVEPKGWKVLYLGANIDAFAEAQKVGVQQDFTMNYATSHGTRAAYSATSSNVMRARNVAAQALASSGGGGVGIGGDWAGHLAYTSGQRESAGGGGTTTGASTTTGSVTTEAAKETE